MKLLNLYWLFLILPCQAQYVFEWETLTPGPMKIANNAVVEAFDGNSFCAYTFGGIDSTKTAAGIHQKAFKFDPTQQVWSALPDLPDTLGKIASGASYVKDKIYIIGGYHVRANGTEISSNKVHVFNPISKQFEADAAPIPLAIDDHVQVVWRDSLIFVVTGWSNTGNVANVQLFNPALNTWSACTPTANTTFFKAFGASGSIVGDTIFYNGGARTGSSFPGTNYLRKGVIDPTNPTQITWTRIEDNPGSNGYRMASSNSGNHVFWVGGSGVTYNYDGIAYNGSGGVNPLKRIISYHTNTATWTENGNEPIGVMDLRGIAKLDDMTWLILGGMNDKQEVLNTTYKLTLKSFPLGIETDNKQITSPHFFPNPVKNQLWLDLDEGKNTLFQIYDDSGKFVEKFELQQAGFHDLSHLQKGHYFIQSERFSKISFIKD